ncbi:hypothetical protein SAMN06295900_102460 [Trinickia caryophylli]|uniref:Uncharacterized protein n=1 Tax=Trinickia caryophylli TaxID=28094 RepID=A0A1X7D6Q4_TRICW|nr:hypothetical protein SAMN06295900_102460 [Trinickia caryophylli]
MKARFVRYSGACRTIALALACFVGLLAARPMQEARFDHAARVRTGEPFPQSALSPTVRSAP